MTTTTIATKTMSDRWSEVASIVAGLLVAALGGWALLGLTAEEPQAVAPPPAVVAPVQVVSQAEPAVPAESIAVEGVGQSVSEVLAARGFAERVDLTGELPDSVLRVLEQNNAVLRIAEVTE